MTILLVSPNWLGDAVMALPAAADVRRQERTSRLAVSARSGVAELWSMVPGVDVVVTLPHGRGLERWAALREGAERLRAIGADAAILLPHSLQSALTARRAGVSERWGYRRGLRGLLLTRAVPAPRGRLHQADYYRHLVGALGFPNGDRVPGSTCLPPSRLPHASGSRPRAGHPVCRCWASRPVRRTAVRSDGPRSASPPWPPPSRAATASRP